MPCLADLSQELVLQIVHFLMESDESYEWNSCDPSGEAQAITSLSRTSTYFYKLLSPFLFRHIVLHNTQKSGNSVQYLAESSQRTSVKTLYFKGVATESEDQDNDDINSHFPSSVETVMSNLALFPNLETLTLHFDLEKVQEGYFLLFLEDQEEETEQQTREAEAKQAWRSLQKQTFEAITSMNSNKCRELIVKIWPLKSTSVFGSKQMKQLESFSFEIYARDEGAGWRTNTLFCFSHYVENLDHYFLDALTNVTRLTISGHEDGPVGLRETYEALVPLKPEHVPKLRELEMRWYFIQETFVDFLKAHSATLERLTLSKCFCIDQSRFTGIANDWKTCPEDVPSWYRFFHTYAASKPSALRHVTLVRETVALELDGEMVRLQKYWEDQGKGRGAFPYAAVDHQFGMLIQNGERKPWALQKERDMEGWEELMAVVRANKEKLAGQV
ncbi:MAG: hypothetical protein L6R35_004293 [Caloplaca aegaea]|nr:MAG: hypothetical protein L6R35_004293 [Caloplaca aegaea]